MTKAERAELKSIIRRRIKVLRRDVEVRQAELLAELDQQIRAKYAEADRRWDVLQHEAKEAASEANRRINDLCREFYGSDKWGATHDKVVVECKLLPRLDADDRRRDRFDGTRAIEARVQAALLELERREAQLLEELATGALESGEARAFLGRIPTVGELVPAYRVPAIEGREP